MSAKTGRGVLHEPTKEQRQIVQLHTVIGTTQEVISRIVGVDLKTLRKHYRDELDLGKAKANAAVGGALFNKAKSGDTAAAIFWMKTQAGWREKDRDDGMGEEVPSLNINISTQEAVGDIRVTQSKT